MVMRQQQRRPQGQVKQAPFTYIPRSASDVKEHLDRRMGAFDSPFVNGIDTFRAKQGENQVRILPPTWDGAKHYGYQVFVHEYVGPDSSSYVCPLKMRHKSCPICQASQEAASKGDDEEAYQLKAKEKFLYWIYDRDDNDSTTPKVWMVGSRADRDILGLTYSRKTGSYLSVDHPDQGQDLIIRRVGSKKTDTSYTYAFDFEKRAIHDDPQIVEQIKDYIAENPLPSILKVYDSNYLEGAISGVMPETEETADEFGPEEASQEDDTAPFDTDEGDLGGEPTETDEAVEEAAPPVEHRRPERPIAAQQGGNRPQATPAARPVQRTAATQAQRVQPATRTNRPTSRQ